MKRRRCLIFGVLALAGCPSPSGNPTPATIDVATPPGSATSVPVASASGSPPSLGAGAWSCRSSGDCLSSCLHGAVNRVAWQAAYPGGEACDDGCASKGAESRCEGGTCVAYLRGNRSEECTHKDAPVLSAPGPAHACSKDTECTMTCSYGAVSARWYASSQRHDCKDGCAESASSPPRCEQGGCVAYEGARRVERCTRRSIHDR